MSLFNNLTVEENICACSLPKKIGAALDKKKMRQISLELLRKLELERIIDTPMRDLPANQNIWLSLPRHWRKIQKF